LGDPSAQSDALPTKGARAATLPFADGLNPKLQWRSAFDAEVLPNSSEARKDRCQLAGRRALVRVRQGGMRNQVGADLDRQLPPRRSKGQEDAVSSFARAIGVGPVEQPVIHDDCVAGLQRNRDLFREVAQGGMPGRSRMVAVGLGEIDKNRARLQVGSRYNAQRSVRSVRFLKIEQDRHLGRRPSEANGMAPAPPVLMPCEGSTVGLFDTRISRNPPEIVAPHCVAQPRNATRRREQDLNDGIRPPQGQKRIVVTNTTRVVGQAIQLSDPRRDRFKLGLRTEILDEDEPPVSKLRPFN